jgi:hypothetical protein
VRIFQPHASGARYFRLTQAGIDRLAALQREPVQAPTD